MTSRRFPPTNPLELRTGSGALRPASLYAENIMEASRALPVSPGPQRIGTPLSSTRAAGPVSGQAASSVEGQRSRRTIGVAVVAGIMLLQVAADVVAARETARVLAHVAFMACELPLLMLALSAAFGWSLRRRMSAGKGLLAGVGIATAFGCVFGLLYGVAALHVPELRLHMSPTGSNAVIVLRSSLFGVLNAQMYFGLWAVAVVYPFAVEGARVRDLEAQQLRSEAEVARLRAHLEPHFLLNTLNAIAGLVTDEPREARRLLVCLGDLLRDAVQDQDDLQPLHKQVAWLRRYAQILETRHRGALSFEWDVAKDCEAELLPRLLLQPLVENAVQHGALQRGDGAGQVLVRVSRNPEGTMVCLVEDNGPGMRDADVRAGAFGLQAVRRRLALEAPDASLRLESSAQGTRSIVEIARPAGGAS
jgi:LytS/YehU family sensor histidine kinase